MRYLFSGMIICSLVLSGCASYAKRSHVEDLEQRISALEGGSEGQSGQIRHSSGAVTMVADSSAYGGSSGSVSTSAKYEKIDKSLQRALKDMGYYKSDIDGELGPGTRKAIMDFQRDHGLKVDGKAGPKTRAALFKRTDLSARDVQTILKNAGYYDGAIDGKLGPKSIEAIKAFQKNKGLKVDGKVGAETKKALLGI
ncbi:MAG: peptidoglycan-binding protein [Candidatus Omnitrophica bacterium]|nr:peptidoglycan-binding protein [Candidatus Omnitrophota bacterium]MDD5487701.1 peptidoglycan-binding protein [Candidatus Omnitrophota bacterium]